MRILPYRTGFQSTLPQRERHQGTTAVLGYWNFNPRSRKGSDHDGNGESRGGKDFNPRSRKGSDGQAMGKRRTATYFNPRSRKGSDHTATPAQIFITISIHAPAKGATDCHLSFSLFWYVFQSTLPQRERRRAERRIDGITGFQSTLPQRERPFNVSPNGGRVEDFNPRSRKGSDAQRCKQIRPDEGISIHAPAKGATGACNGKRYDD